MAAQTMTLYEFRDRMAHWLEAYSEDIFTDYSISNGDKPTIDQVSAKAGRHILSILIKDFDEILRAQPQEWPRSALELSPDKDAPPAGARWLDDVLISAAKNNERIAARKMIDGHTFRVEHLLSLDAAYKAARAKVDELEGKK